MGGSCKKGSDHIEDLLPEDPFGMKIRFDFVTFTSWPEDPFGMNIASDFLSITSCPEDPFGMSIGSEFMTITSWPEDPFGMNIPSDFLSITSCPEDPFGMSWPEDPFGMNIGSDFLTITSWPEDPFGMDIMSDFSLMWNVATMFQSEEDEFMRDEFMRDELFNDQILYDSGFVFYVNMEEFYTVSELGNEIDNGPTEQMQNFETTYCEEGEFIGDEYDVLTNDQISYDSGFVCYVNMEEFYTVSDLGNEIDNDQAEEIQNFETIYCEKGEPHDAMFFALRFLGLKDLLTVERVCRSLREAVKTDTLLWQSIEVRRPLSDRVTDDALLQLTTRAQGTLKYLMLMECTKITNAGLKRVLECNPGLTKLSVPGCMRLTVECILSNLRALKSAGNLSIEHLRIGGLKLYDVTDKHFEELKCLLGADNRKQPGPYKPQYYCVTQLYLNCDDDRPIDIDVCPRCHSYNIIYDCPRESCQANHQSSEQCRACVLCIRRCFHCGRCIERFEYEENFFFQPHCLEECVHAMYEVAYQETTYNFFFYG